jgi:hypothetical protein
MIIHQPSAVTPIRSAPAELLALRRGAPRIKAFVARHGERSITVFAQALEASFKDPERLTHFLLTAPLRDDPAEACRIVRSIGFSAAALLPQLVASYYCKTMVDRYA